MVRIIICVQLYFLLIYLFYFFPHLFSLFLTFIFCYLPFSLPSLISLFYFIHYISTSIFHYVPNLLLLILLY